MDIKNNSEPNSLLNENFKELKDKSDFTIAISGNPNVGKSTIFNNLTGMHQHTGNWPGKTVSNSAGLCKHKDKNFLLVDIPGTYSLMSNSEEEEIARNYICFGNPDLTIVVVDSTCMERNLNLVYQVLEITKNVIVCVNLLDEAKKKNISIDFEGLSKILGVPVIGTTARKPKSLSKLMDMVYSVCNKDVECNPKCVKYPDIIEKNIDVLAPYVEKYISINKYINRWLCLKLIDDDKTILNSIEKFLDIDLKEDININSQIVDIHEELLEKGIRKSHIKDFIVSSIILKVEEVCSKTVLYTRSDYNQRDRKIDKILTSKTFGIPIMILFLGIIFWITIVGANYPSQMLFNFFGFIEDKLLVFFEFINSPEWLTGILVSGVYKTLTWVVAVMLPPMAIFFPLFTILEDLGYLPRIAFNLDKFFKKACASGKQSLTMCMGFGCNSAGVIGCRIINSPREKLIAILTNVFVPCNGRFPFLITISTIFIGGIGLTYGSSLLSTLAVLAIIIFGIYMTLVVSKILSKTVLKGVPSSFILELPPYRKPQFGKIFVRSIFDRTLFVLGRAVAIAAPAGLVIWLFANITISDINLLTYIANFLNPFAKLMGMDGYILTAFILGLPANEIVLPIILMSYLSTGSLVDLENYQVIGEILIQNGWTMLTALNVMIFTLLHFPCSTTLLTIHKETGSIKWTIASFLIPTICGIVCCMLTTFVYNIFV